MGDDQAHGLRRLFARREARMLGVLGDEATAVTLELAAAFARLSQRVLLVDRTCGEAALGLGLRARFELRHALMGDRTLRQVALDGPQGIVVLPAARGLDVIESEAGAAMKLTANLDAALGPFDLILVNGAPLYIPGAGVLLTLAPTSSAITLAYTELKKLARAGSPRRCEIAVHKARSEAAALDAFDSVAITAGRFLGMTLALAGTMPGAPRPFHAEGRDARSRAATRIAQRLTASPPPTRKAVNH
jgi:flagellar biosynthesis protein FlhG